MKAHKWKRREMGGSLSRYWDCVNAGCGDFFYDMRRPARVRAPSAAASKKFTGKCLAGVERMQ